MKCGEEQIDNCKECGKGEESNSCGPSVLTYGSSCGSSTPIYRGC